VVDARGVSPIVDRARLLAHDTVGPVPRLMRSRPAAGRTLPVVQACNALDTARWTRVRSSSVHKRDLGYRPAAGNNRKCRTAVPPAKRPAASKRQRLGPEDAPAAHAALQCLRGATRAGAGRSGAAAPRAAGSLVLVHHGNCHHRTHTGPRVSACLPQGQAAADAAAERDALECLAAAAGAGAEGRGAALQAGALPAACRALQVPRGPPLRAARSRLCFHLRLHAACL